MTLNERLLKVANEMLGSDPQFTLVMSLFEGNILSIPEHELREYLDKTIAILTGVLEA